MSKRCCARYKKGKKPCDDCPDCEDLGKKERKKLLRKYRDKAKDKKKS